METLNTERQYTIDEGLDFYKPTMSQLHYEKHPDVEVTFTFKNRGEQRIADYVAVDDLQARLDMLRDKNWTDPELNFFASLRTSDGERQFSDKYLDYLANNTLPPVHVSIDSEKNDIACQTTGDAPLVTFWETVVMSEVNEMYFENYMLAHNINPAELYEEGDRRLTEKINLLKQYPSILFSDFGTRRHFSYKWQAHVMDRVQTECPDNFLGTSNVALSRENNKKPIGTFAHEMPMIYAGIADAKGEDIRESHREFLNDWREKHGDDLSTALTDTFGSEFFFADFTLEQAEEWKALRHDSGDPFEFGERVIEFYESKGIDPLAKTIVFSDGLDIDTIIKLHERFEGRIGNIYGWGTTLTNDLGLKALNIVMKATHVRLPDGREADLVKLSDNEGKHTGPDALIELYQRIFNPGRAAVRDVVTC